MIVADASWIIALRDPLDAHHQMAVLLNDQHADDAALLHPLTLAECLVGAAKHDRLHESAAALRAAFRIVSVDDDAPVRWADLRASMALRLPDAVVLDTALQHAAGAILTFDERLADAARSHGLAVPEPD